jgi:diaminohydroxyphosphoribosylaminopyrimidine deaminase / 5-amino-6-(5-phosphoribosylamino)uracil reductase
MSADEQLLRRALDLARQGLGQASPNPYVGAVISDPQGKVVGAGTYTYAGVKHAELLALEEAGSKARGGTLYINLEPHAHQGRTPPCTDALIAAGIRRVVASTPDPNPRVSGRGFDQLRLAGVQVEVGLLQDEARRLNEGFARYIRHGTPLVTLKSAMTLNAKIAPPPENQNRPTHADKFPGHSINRSGINRAWITGELARAHVQQLRHQHDALLTGIGTILGDNPLLTDRSGRPRRRPLLRVVLDSHLCLSLESRLVQSAAAERKNDLLVFCSTADEEKRSQLEYLGVRVEKFPAGPGGRPDLLTVLRRLAQLEITTVMIEAGATVNATALASNAVDKVFFYYSPTIFASTGSIPFATHKESSSVTSTAQVKQIQVHRFGEDIAVEGYLRDPYGD